MHILTAVGFALAGGIIVTDHHIHRIPNKLAVALYIAALAVMITGMILTRKHGG